MASSPPFTMPGRWLGFRIWDFVGIWKLGFWIFLEPHFFERLVSFIRTVLGDIAPSALGICYAHEHLIIEGEIIAVRFPELLLDSVEHACRELETFRRAGGRAMIDTMPWGAGRNVRKLAEISRRTGIHVVAPTGLHLPKYYKEGHPRFRLDADGLADVFVAEIDDGIDTNERSGPHVEQLPHRAGVIKVASGGDRLDAHEKTVFTAAAAAHRRTGAPVLTHTQHGQAALEQVEILGKGGVDLRHVVLSHTDRNANVSHHRAILKTGVNVECDGAFRWKTGERNGTLDLLVALLPEFPDQIMLGTDAARRAYWRSYGGGPGLDFLLAEFSRRMREAGIGENLLRKVFVENPARTFAFLRSA